MLLVRETLETDEVNLCPSIHAGHFRAQYGRMWH